MGNDDLIEIGRSCSLGIQDWNIYKIEILNWTLNYDAFHLSFSEQKLACIWKHTMILHVCQVWLIISIFLFQTLKFWISKFCKQHEGFRNLIGHQLQAIKIKLKGKGHQVVAVENLLKILKGLKKMTIICSKANLSQVSKIGLCESRKASLPFGLSSVEKEFYVEEHHRIDSVTDWI